MGDGKWNGYEWWFHGQHTDASFNSLSISLSLSMVCDCLNCCWWCCCCCIVFAMRFALLIRRFRSLYIFVHSSSGISVVCRNLPRMIFIYSFSSEAANSNWRQEEDNIHFCACLRARWPIADVANDRHPSERGAHCTILQQQWTYVCIYILYICIQISDALLSSSFSLHDCTIIITALFHLLVFFLLYFRDDFALRFWHWKQSDKFVKTLTLTQTAQPTPLPAGIY